MNVLIYEDEDMKVEIDEVFDRMLRELQPKDYILDDNDLEEVLDKVFEILKEQNIKPCKIKVASNVPIIKSMSSVKFQSPYDVFNGQIFCLTLMPTLEGFEEDYAKNMNDIYGDSGFFCHIFKERIHEVKGFMLQQSSCGDTLILFAFEDFTQNIDFLEDL